MATVITISVANDTVGQTVTAAFTINDNDQLLQAYLAMMTAARSRGDVPQQLPTILDAMNNIPQLCWRQIQQTANQYYEQKAMQTAQQNVVPIIAQTATSSSQLATPIGVQVQ